jgi:hypothetical protein
MWLYVDYACTTAHAWPEGDPDVVSSDDSDMSVEERRHLRTLYLHATCMVECLYNVGHMARLYNVGHEYGSPM